MIRLEDKSFTQDCGQSTNTTGLQKAIYNKMIINCFNA